VAPAQTAVVSRALGSAQTGRSLFRTFDQAIGRELLSNGVAVVDNAIAAVQTARMRMEIDTLAASGALSNNCTHFTSPSKPSSPVRIDKRNIREIEWHMATQRQRSCCPALTELEGDTGLRALLNVYIPSLTLTSQACKPQLNTGGCFPLHVDSDAAVDNRKVTAILYLNEQWDSKRDGGDLRVYTSPGKSVDIAPVDCRLVLMSSTETTHRVLPSLRRARYACTLWLSGTSKRVQAPPILLASTTDLTLILNDLRIRRHATRVALSQEWEHSLCESHGEANAEDAVRHHRDDTARTQRALIKVILKLFPNVPMANLSAVIHEPEALKALMSGQARDGSVPVVQWL
jgi:hypothetical protein